MRRRAAPPQCGGDEVSYKPSAADVKSLRERTGAGMMDVRDALVETEGDAEAAARVLRERGTAKAAKLAGRETTEGKIGSYVHTGGQKGVLVEVRCNTDFVANSESFNAFVKDVLLQIVSSENTRWVAIADVPDAIREGELEVYRAQAADKPENVREKIAEGKLRKWYEEVCLLEQPYFRDEKQTVEQVRAGLAHETGENIQIARFARFEVGGV
jgi:elongation factor Ts